MRVLAAIVVPPHLTVSGGARAGEALSAALADRCDITVANMMGGDPAIGGHATRVAVRTSLPPPLRHPRVPKRYRSLFYRSDIPRLIRRGGYDLVHIHNPMPALEMARIARTCRRLDIPYVVSTHGFNEVVNGLKIYAFNPVQRAVWAELVAAPVCRAVAGAADIFALSPHDRDLIEALGRSGQDVTIVSNGVATPPTANAADDRQALAALGIDAPAPGAPPTFLFLANHTPNKGLPLLLDAFSRLREPFQLIVGGEKREGIDYESHVRRSRPGQRIVVTGRLSDADAAACFRRADAFVFPTLADTFPLVVLEAMSHGKAVIASAVGGIPYQLEGGCGELVPSGDPEALAQAVARLAAEPSRLAAMGEAGRRRARDLFTWNRAADAALGGYERVLRAAAPRPSRASPLIALRTLSSGVARLR
ncbi:glycosyltransferase family 4 protein [Jiella sp. M17.18]|uniref:glycosyltransferase family 4 protein n=1 Tax=Jiella sp. M17.18 TaxID=3234247 RepID=UPI0034DF3E88